MPRDDIVVLKNVRLGFPKLFTPERATEDGPLKYSAHGIIDPNTTDGRANVEQVKAAQRHVAEATWGVKWQQIVKSLEPNRRAFRDGATMVNSEGELYAGYDGMKYVSASRKEKQGRPQLLDRRKNPVAEEDGLLYGGCYVDMIVSFYTTNGRKQGGNGVFASLELVRFRQHGEPFGAAPVDADEYLDELDDDDDDAVANLDDADEDMDDMDDLV